MTNLFEPTNWNNGPTGGTPISAERGPRRWEAGIEAIDNAMDDFADRLDALEGGGSARHYVGSTTDRATVAPGAGVEWFDTDLGRPVWGNGSAWIYADGTTVGASGAPGAPQNFAGVLQADGTVDFTWSAVSGADSYTLYVNGSDAAPGLTGTSYTLPDGVAVGVVTFWLTATDGGVESAASNSVQIDGSGIGGGDTPAEILNINGEGTAAGGWWNVGIGFSSSDPEGSKHIDVSASDIASGYIRDPYFTPTSGNGAVQFRIRVDGARTSSNTKYPRSELRELKSDGTTKASWNPNSGTHILQGESRWTHQAAEKPEVVFAQMHDASDDTLQLRFEGSTIVLKVNGDEVEETIGSASSGTWVSWKILVDSGNLTVYINNSVVYESDPGWGSGQYFKTGCYAQANNRDQSNSASDYFAIEMRNLALSHS